MSKRLPSVAEYSRALKLIRQRLTTNQLRMLRYHLAQDGPVTARELAEVAGFKSHGGANLQYGLIGTHLREASPDIRSLPGQKSYAFAEFEQVPGAEWLWYLHKPFETALRRTRWLDGQGGAPATERGVSADE